MQWSLAIVDEALPPENVLRTLDPLALAVIGGVVLALVIAALHRWRKREHERHDV